MDIRGQILTPNPQFNQPMTTKGEATPVMKAFKFRLKSLSWWLAGAFFVRCLFIYLNVGRHAAERLWQTVYYDPLMWPLDWPLQCIYALIGDWLAPGDPREVAPSVWAILDSVGEVVLVVSGTLWHWLIGRIVSLLLGAIFPPRPLAAKVINSN
jgi:hypothetical protein